MNYQKEQVEGLNVGRGNLVKKKSMFSSDPVQEAVGLTDKRPIISALCAIIDRKGEIDSP
jgi:hypothetical protein